jgi:endonuclease III
VARTLNTKARARVVAERLAEIFPGSAKELCALNHENPYQLLVATILSAQTTDERVNLVTPALFARYREPEDLAGAEFSELEELIRSTGFFRQKSKSLVGMASGLVERFGGEVPTALEDLVTLPGVGRKTANVVRSVAFGLPGLPVDTHVGRLARRLHLSSASDPDVVERDLCALVPEDEWGALSLRLILHGRQTCTAKKPLCATCVLADVCPSAGTFDAAPATRRRTRTTTAPAR